MAEERVNIPVENGETVLDGLFEQGRTGRNAIICHPHPLYGGNMHNSVVQAAQRTYAALGWTTLRFNFRAAVPDNPEQGQRDGLDLLDVSNFVRSRSPGPTDFAGYSHGAWSIMTAVRAGLCPDSLILVSPPLDFLSFEGLRPPRAPTLITLGDRDEFCAVQTLQSWLSTGPDSSIAVEILEDVDHFYRGAEHKIMERMKTFLAGLGRGAGMSAVETVSGPV
jgi:alpha/beta superfamily hydrolase